MVKALIWIVVFVIGMVVIAVIFGRARSLGGRLDYGLGRLRHRNRRTVEIWKHTRKIEEDAGEKNLEPVPWWVCYSCLWTGDKEQVAFTLREVVGSGGCAMTSYCPDCRGELELY